MSDVRKERVAVYSGTFDPITNGHLDTIKRSSRLFDRVIVAVAKDNYKNTLFPTECRTDMIEESIEDLDNVEVDTFSGLLVDYLKSKNTSIVIRGLRAISDFEHEMQITSINRALDSNYETVLLMSDYKYSFISSSVIKKIACLGGDVSAFIPSYVQDKLKEKYKSLELI